MNCNCQGLLGWVLVLASMGFAAPAHGAAGESRVNVLFLLADDLGYGDLHCFGAKDLRTPRLDGLARQGVRFTQYYASGPECTPTRAAFLTGRYQQRVEGLECAIGIGGVGRYDDAIRLAAKHELGLPTSEPTIARFLHDAGYATAITGKWHLGYEEQFSANRHGFDFALTCVGGEMDYFHHVEDPPAYTPALRLNGETVKRSGYATDLFADEAIRWMRDHVGRYPDQPFFLYVPFTAPHAPYQAPGEQQPQPLPKDSIRWKQGKAPPAVYDAMIERLDTDCGRILDTLDELHLSDNTLVVFSSDNGGTASARQNGLRGIKGMTFEGGIRVPAIARWPKILPADQECSEPVMTIDFSDSILHAAHVAPTRPLDGEDVLGFLSRQQPFPSRPLFWRGRRGEQTWRAIRDGDLKYVTHTKGPNVEEFLFDLAHDPGEKQNLLADRPADAARLKQTLSRWEAEVRPVR